MAGLNFPQFAQQAQQAQMPSPFGVPGMNAPVPIMQPPFAPPLQESQPQQESSIFDTIQGDPSALLALLRFAGDALQPVMPGDTTAGVLGRALSGAVGQFAQGRKSEQDTGVRKEGVGVQREGIQAEKEIAKDKLNLTEKMNYTLNDLQEAEKWKTQEMAKYYSRMPKDDTGSGKADPWTDNNFVTNWAKVNNMTLSEAAVDIYKYKESAGISDPGTAANKAAAEAAGNLTYTPEQQQAQDEFLRSLPSTVTKEFAKEDLQELATADDAKILQISANPEAEKKVVARVGQAAFDRRVRQALANQNTKK